jgi:hypothetical protein
MVFAPVPVPGLPDLPPGTVLNLNGAGLGMAEDVTVKW